MDNDLFNQNLMKKLASDKELQLTVTRHDLIKDHLSKLENGDFKSETSNYLYFYEVILKEILGYDLEENILFDEKEDAGRGKSEFVLKNGDKKFMVVELKGSDSDLDKPQNRANDKRTPVDQAFDYAQHTGDIDWILVSNYNEFRLYNWHTKGKYISFMSEELLEKDVFSYFMLSFSRMSHISSGYADKLIQETILVEKKLEKNFYKLFHETRLMLLKEIEENNDLSREEAIHYAQLILNRYMFICFAEDIENLLPSQLSTQTLSKPIKDGDIGGTALWRRLNELFEYIDVGNEFKGISKYNGGLFKDDLSFLKIRDLIDDVSIFKETWQKWDFEKDLESVEELIGPHGAKINPIYKNLLVISSFDFSSELDVNILGHVFENSIGDIEELKADDRGRRKKDGVFYTPEYITDYICRNTIIPYLSLSGEANTVEELVKEYWGTNIDKLDVKLKNIKIVDPACGSGAFLNKGADVLLEIHEAIHELLYKENKSLDRYIDNIGQRREILLNNIYGVDLNEESVEITKLSLFLKVCKKGLALPNLDDNIKCGNPLIDDKEFAGDKAFNWDEEFRAIFDDGGFDVVVGNPPYVKQGSIKEIKPFLKKNYEVYTGMSDLFVYFFERGLNLLKNKGMFSFICSNKFTQTKNDEPLRNFILKHKFVKYVDYTGKGVFEEATTNPAVFVIKKAEINDNKLIINDDFEISQKRLDNGIWSLKNPQILDLMDKIMNIGIKLKDVYDLNIYYGIKTGFDKAFIIDKNTKDELITENRNNQDIIKSLIRGKDIKRYKIDDKDLYLLFTPIGVSIDNYPSIKDHFTEYEDKLKKRVDQGKHWWELRACAYYEDFKKEKIMWGNLSIGPNFGYSKDELFTTAPANILTGENIKYLLPILNSKVIFFIFKLIGVKVDSGYSEWKKNRVEELPIYPATPEQQEPFIEKADQMLDLNKTLQNETNSFKEWLAHIFKVEKFSKKLEKYYELSLDEFLAELKKKKVDVKNRENFTSLKEEFEKSVSKIRPLLQEIEETDNEIDQMVYELYSLNDDEIKIIEDSLN